MFPIDLAKVASKHRKPAGFTVIPGRAIAAYLEDLPVERIWGIGPATTDYLRKMGVLTALQFARLPETTIHERFTKPGIETWQELRGESVYPVLSEEKSSYASISKTKTFAPPTADREYLFAHLLRNLESACIKARRYGLVPRQIAVFLKKQNFDMTGREARLSRPSAHPIEVFGRCRRGAPTVREQTTLYGETRRKHLGLPLFQAQGIPSHPAANPTEPRRFAGKAGPS